MVQQRRTDISQWQRVKNILRPRKKMSQLVVGLLCLALGFSMAIQVREIKEAPLDQMSQQDLVRLLDESNRHLTELQQESRQLELTLSELETGQKSSRSAYEAAQARLRTLRILAGSAPAEGTGVVVRVFDNSSGIRAQTLLTVLEELRNAGAEVIQINDVRIVASSYITGEPGELMVDGSALENPYVFKVIGPADVIAPALKIPGGAADSVSADGGRLAVETVDNVSIDAVVEVKQPRFAQENGK